MPPAGRCDQCVFYRQHVKHTTHGRCERFPPQVDGMFWEIRFQTNTNPDKKRNYPGRGIFPLVKGTETCGEFKAIGGGDDPADPDPVDPDIPDDFTLDAGD